MRQIGNVILRRGGKPSLRSDEHTDPCCFTVGEACALDNLALAGCRASFRSLTEVA